jgi:DNA-binding cell septation regulator SpoVG
MIEITDFRNTRLLNSGKLRAFVDVVFNGALVVKGFKVIEGSKGYFVAAPARKVDGKNGEPDTWNDVVYFTKESGAWSGIQEKILAHYKEGVASGGADADI